MTLLNEIESKRLKFKHIQLHYKDFVERETLRLAQEIVIPAIVNKMMNEGFSRKIWQNTDATKAEIINTRIMIVFN